MLARKHLLRKIRRKDDGGIDIAILEGRVHLAGSDIDGFQLIFAGQQFIYQRIDEIAVRARWSHEGKRMHATGTGQYQVEHAHDGKGYEEDQGKCTPVTQHLVNNTTG